MENASPGEISPHSNKSKKEKTMWVLENIAEQEKEDFSLKAKELISQEHCSESTAFSEKHKRG